jgi:hypothetical protein
MQNFAHIDQFKYLREREVEHSFGSDEDARSPNASLGFANIGLILRK